MRLQKFLAQAGVSSRRAAEKLIAGGKVKVNGVAVAALGTLARPEGERPTLAEFVDDLEVGWKVVAPLDFPAEGVVLLTTDGELAERMSRGGGHVPMTYHLKFQGAVGAAELERLRKGWRWLGRPVRPIAVEALATTGKNT